MRILLSGLLALAIASVISGSFIDVKRTLSQDAEVSRLEWVMDELVDELKVDDRYVYHDDLKTALTELKSRGGRIEWLADEALDELD